MSWEVLLDPLITPLSHTRRLPQDSVQLRLKRGANNCLSETNKQTGYFLSRAALIYCVCMHIGAILLPIICQRRPGNGDGVATLEAITCSFRDWPLEVQRAHGSEDGQSGVRQKERVCQCKYLYEKVGAHSSVVCLALRPQRSRARSQNSPRYLGTTPALTSQSPHGASRRVAQIETHSSQTPGPGRWPVLERQWRRTKDRISGSCGISAHAWKTAHTFDPFVLPCVLFRIRFNQQPAISLEGKAAFPPWVSL